MKQIDVNEIAISREIWEMKYRFKNPDGTAIDRSINDSFERVASAIAMAEKPSLRDKWEKQFLAEMTALRFLPAGRVLSGAGTARKVTMFNCFVMGAIDDSISGIFDELKHAAQTMQQGGGIGQDFSTIRPAGAPVSSIGADASGPLSFMDVWDAMCGTIMSAGSRRGAMMATMACDHPDIEAFIEAKRDPAKLRNFNLSVLVSDAFMQAVDDDLDWPLKFAGKTYKTVKAKSLWEKLTRASYDVAEPGVIFIDRINSQNNLQYCETIHATNPCGEQPLPEYGACLLGSLNLARFITGPFAKTARLDEDALAKSAAIAVRFLDNVIDLSKYPLSAQAHEATTKRRIGLGITGLADALAMCNQRYGSTDSAEMAANWMQIIERSAYRTSAELAREKGAFALYDPDEFLKAPGIVRLDKDTQKLIAKNGIRNALLTSIAPTGTISLLAGNVSSGIEPIFATQYNRKILQDDGSRREEKMQDYAVALYRKLFRGDEKLPSHFITASQLTPKQHLRMQAALQPHVDSAISKTINCDVNIDFDKFADIYRQAFNMGLKGCTIYRPNAVTGSVLEATESQSPDLEIAASTDKDSSEIIYMKQPLERDPALSGFTYKLKWPDSSHAIYITVNDIIQNNRCRPFEVFINSKNMEHYAWTVALTRMISAVFRRGGDVSFVVEELQAVFDPRGGQWMDGKYVPSLLAAIGNILERHMKDIGFLKDKHLQDDREVKAVVGTSSTQLQCPQCGQAALSFQEGCATCLACDYSKCS